MSFTSQEIKEIRKDFPILQEKVNGFPLVYFDNAATTQKPIQVIQKIVDFYSAYNANVHRGVHYLSQKATDEHEASREFVKDFIGASSSNEIIFTRGTTESINMLASIFSQRYLEKDDEVIISEMEHHSNIVSWQLQSELSGAKLKVAKITDRGELPIGEIANLITPKTKLISLTHSSNVLGTVNPIKEIIRIAHEHNIPVLIDAAQSVPHISIDVKDLDCDFLAFSAHKTYGPTGIGVLYGKEKFLRELPPYHGGGEMVKNVSFEKTTYGDIPFKFEAGTPNYVGSAAMAEGLKYMSNLGMDRIAEYEHSLLTYATDEMRKIPDLKIYGETDQKGAIVSFAIDKIHHYDLGVLLDQMGIAIRTGHHCAQPLMDRFNVSGLARVSFSFYNTEEEIDLFIKSLKKTITLL